MPLYLRQIPSFSAVQARLAVSEILKFSGPHLHLTDHLRILKEDGALVDLQCDLYGWKGAFWIRFFCVFWRVCKLL